MGQKSNVAWNGGEELEVLIFDLSGESFAIEAVKVREIMDHVSETRVPGAGALAGALVNFRGRVIPLVDLRHGFGLERRPDTVDSRIIVVEAVCRDEDTLVGLRADKVHEVTTVGAAASTAPPRIGMKWRPELIRTLVKHRGDFIVVPDFDYVFAQTAAKARPAAIALV